MLVIPLRTTPPSLPYDYGVASTISRGLGYKNKSISRYNRM